MVDSEMVAEEEIQWAQELRRLLLKEGVRYCDQAVVHASQCCSYQCPEPSCPEMKRVVHHAQACLLKVSGGCRVCGQLNVLASLHARDCRTKKCPVPFCSEAKALLQPDDSEERWRRCERELEWETTKLKMLRARNRPKRLLPPFLVFRPRTALVRSAVMPCMLHIEEQFSALRMTTLPSTITRDPLQELEKRLENLSTTEK